MIKTAESYLEKHGEISIPLLQWKMKLDYATAKKLYEKIMKGEKKINGYR